jgi:hypothetical protein
VDCGELRAATGLETARLRALIRQAIETSSGNNVRVGGRLFLGRVKTILHKPTFIGTPISFG